jgi:hypothetical protein
MAGIQRKFDDAILELLEASARNVKAMPINLGGVSGSGGGAGIPPAGFVGQLVQTRVAYDADELATLYTPPSGMSLLDNLNHIRYRLQVLESGGSSLLVREADGTPSVSNVTILTFSGAVVTDLSGGEALITVSGGGSPLTVKEADGTPTVANVSTLTFSGLVVQNLGAGQAQVSPGSLESLSNVSASNPSNNDILAYNSSAGTWGLSSAISTGWTPYTMVIPTLQSSDGATYVLSFANVNLTNIMGVGMRVRWVQNSTTRYGIITGISYSTNTLLTLYCGTDYGVLNTNTYPISNFAYSAMKAPLGFPLQASKWSVRAVDGVTYTKTSPTSNTWYGQTNLMDGGATLPKITIPIGLWKVGYKCMGRSKATSGGFSRVETALSPSPSTASDADLIAVYSFSAAYDIGGALSFNGYMNCFPKEITLTTKTDYYLLIRTPNGVEINVQGVTSSTILEAVCAYL